jgi:hypothetical protein
VETERLKRQLHEMKRRAAKREGIIDSQSQILHVNEHKQTGARSATVSSNISLAVSISLVFGPSFHVLIPGAHKSAGMYAFLENNPEYLLKKFMLYYTSKSISISYIFSEIWKILHLFIYM